MSCITVPKQWGGAATVAPRIEAVLPTATIQRRTTKKARATPQLVDTVREVVQAFEFEYAQVRADSVQLKAVLDEGRTQLSDQRHLEKESSENGTLEAVVQHRSEKNQKGDARLAALELDFSVIVGDDRVIASRLAAFESDLAVMTQEYRRVKERTSFGAAQLDRVEAALDQREQTVAAVLRESDRLRGEVEDGRKAVEERQCLVRAKQERASRARSLASEAAVELEVLSKDTSMLEEEVIGKESQCESAVVALEAIKLQASEAQRMISEERACRAAGIAVSQIRLAELKQQIAAQEKSKADLEERIQTTHDAITSEAEVHAKKRDEIEAIQSSWQESVEAAKLELSGQLDLVAKEVAQAESAVTDSSERIRQANIEFSNLMAAMSAAFKEYDKAVTTTRELERGTTEAESALNSLRETTKQELSVLCEKCDRLSASNAEEHLAVDAAAKKKAELDDTLCVTQSALTAITAEVEFSRMKVADGKERVRKGQEAKRMEVEKRMEAARLAKVAETEAKEAVVVARARLEQQQIELIKLDRGTTQWHPPPVELSTKDLERVEAEAKVVVKSVRKSDDEAHAIRLQSLKDTLTTIKEGGEARLKAEKDAAAARLAALRGQIREVSQSLTELRSRSEEAAREEENIHQELSRRAAGRRRAAEQQEAAAASAAAQDATAAKATAAAARFMTPEARSTNHLSVGLRTPSARPVTHVRTQPPPPKQQVVHVSVPTEAGVTSSSDIYGGQGRAVRDRETQERESSGQVEPDSARTEADDGQSKQHQQPRQPVRRSKKSSRSSSKDHSARSSQQRQIASESTAEATGSRHMSTSAGRKYSDSKSSSTSKRKDKDRNSTHANTMKFGNRVAATTDESSFNCRGRSSGDSHKSSEGTKRASKSLDRSPRPRPRP